MIYSPRISGQRFEMKLAERTSDAVSLHVFGNERCGQLCMAATNSDHDLAADVIDYQERNEKMYKNHSNYPGVDPRQCEQIGRFLKVFGDSLSFKVFGDFWGILKTYNFLSKNCILGHSFNPLSGHTDPR